MTEPVPNKTAPEKTKSRKVIKIILIVLGIMAVFAVALSVGLAIGYQFITKTSGSNIFNGEIWKNFFQQIRALK